MNDKLSAAEQIEHFNLELDDTIDEQINNLPSVIIAPELSQELQEEEWELQNSGKWIAEYEQAQAEKDLTVIEHWFYLELDTTRIRGIHKESQQIITTSRIVDITDGVLITGSGSTYKLIHQINSEEEDGASDICKYWPMYQGA